MKPLTIELTDASDANPITVFVDKICNLQASETFGQTIVMFPGGGVIHVTESQNEILAAIEESYQSRKEPDAPHMYKGPSP